MPFPVQGVSEGLRPASHQGFFGCLFHLLQPPPLQVALKFLPPTSNCVPMPPASPSIKYLGNLALK